MTTTRTTYTVCPTCRAGCTCDGSAGDLDCGHFACWGRERKNSTVQECAGAEYERARRVALRAELSLIRLRAARKRGLPVYQRVEADILRAHDLPVASDY